MIEQADVVIVGAGVSGLGYANWYREKHPDGSVLVLEGDREVGGYCKTIEQAGFVWDYSGHFFHFKRPEIEAWLRARMPGEDIRTVEKLSYIRYGGADIDFPFQKNIHQLPKAEFIECLVDLFARPTGPVDSFGAMLEAKLGRAITEKFLRPYNEKLYATALENLDPDAMGRFFPHADIADIVANMRPRGDVAKDGGYNAVFTYPAGGAIRYIHALLRDLPAGTVACSEPLVALDLERRIARTPAREIRYGHLVSSAPLPALARAARIPHDAAAFTANSVLVFNLGFDRKGRDDVHWMYFPDRARSFYRVGWYDNIVKSDRMSLYVEIGAASGADFDVTELRRRVLADLRAEGIATDHKLVASHHVVLDPAYCHITKRSIAETARVREALAAHGVHSVGRYGGWTYCSIEDNLIETRALADRLG